MRRSLMVASILCLSALAAYATTRPAGLFHPRLPDPPPQDEVSVALRSPGLHLRLALPDFFVAPADATAAPAARTIAAVLWADLDFEREYYLIDRQVGAQVPVASVDDLPNVQWAELGADLVLAAEARAIDHGVLVDVRILWVSEDHRGEQLFGRSYTCPLATARAPRDCAHQMADDIHRETRGLIGVAQSRIAFVSDRDHGRIAGSSSIAPAKEVYVADYDGANATRITSVHSTTCCANWSNAQALTYVSWQAGWPDIYLLNLADASRALARPPASRPFVNNWSPAWSPDGQHLAFASNRSGNVDVWVANADGGGLVNLTNHPSADGAPTWSPDGSQIAFTSDRTGTNELYIMSAQGSDARVIVRDPVDRPSWSSANAIVFTLAPQHGHKEIGLYDVASGRVSVLTDSQFDSENPSVSPNGRHIAFETTRWGGHQIAVMDRTGANIRAITTSGENSYASWEQAPR